MYSKDEYTPHEISSCLESTGRKVRIGSRYLMTTCLWHEERNPSMQVHLDGWTNCFAGCKGQHISSVFPELRRKDPNYKPTRKVAMQQIKPVREVKQTQSMITKNNELYKSLELIPRDHKFKGIPLQVLDDLGWRYKDNKYFIPYWDMNRQNVMFYQWRNLSGDVRFNFAVGQTPVAYGSWNMADSGPIFIVEGCSDAATMQFAAVPWVSMPSASSSSILEALCAYTKKYNNTHTDKIDLIFAGDNDEASFKLEESMNYRFSVKRPPVEYKDWSDFMQATSVETVQEYCLGNL
jgi:hypothetical protein